MVNLRRQAHGFSLIELIVVVAILGIAMGIAVPGLQSLLAGQKMKSATFDLITTAMLARSEAIKWGGASGAAISIVAPANNFNNGWCITFTSTVLCDLAAPDDGVMQIIKPTAGVNYVYQGVAAPIVFNRGGRLASGGSVRLQVDDRDGSATSRCVSIDSSGNATVKPGACA